VPRIHRILPVIAALALFPGCGQAAQRKRPVPQAPSPAEADQLAVQSGTAFLHARLAGVPRRVPHDVVVEQRLNGRRAGGSRSAVTLVAAAAAAAANGYRDNAALLLHAAAAQQQERPTYYGDAWTALGRLLLTTQRLDVRPC
jgi:hypothetical protein